MKTTVWNKQTNKHIRLTPIAVVVLRFPPEVRRYSFCPFAALLLSYWYRGCTHGEGGHINMTMRQRANEASRLWDTQLVWREEEEAAFAKRQRQGDFLSKSSWRQHCEAELISASSFPPSLPFFLVPFSSLSVLQTRMRSSAPHRVGFLRAPRLSAVILSFVATCKVDVLKQSGIRLQCFFGTIMF